MVDVGYEAQDRRDDRIRSRDIHRHAVDATLVRSAVRTDHVGEKAIRADGIVRDQEEAPRGSLDHIDDVVVSAESADLLRGARGLKADIES